MKKNVNRVLAYLLSAMMTFSVVPTQAVYAENASGENARQIAATELEGESRLENRAVKANDPERPDVQRYADDELVTVIVELDAAPVLDYFGVSAFAANTDAEAGEAVSDFLTSDEAAEIAEEITEQQNEVLEQLIEEVNEAEVVDQWNSVTNAVAVKVPYGQLEKIQKMDGVRRAYVEHVFDRPDEPITEEAGEIAAYSYDMVGIQETWNSGYTGKGMLVAILDTGLDMNWQAYSEPDHLVSSHEAFRDDSFKNADAKEVLRYTNESMEQFLKDNTLNAEFRGGNEELTYDYNALYKNEKIPFAYDYADLDLNVQPGSSSHGTHVAGTIGGYVEDEEGAVKFSGVAPDAQLMIMKVFPDADGGAQESDMVAALEDAVKLGADVINLSLGSDNGFAEDDTIQEELYDRVRAAGILLMTSAGNSASSPANNNYGGNNLESNPETSMMSSPAVYDSNLAVASINNSVDVISVFEWTDNDGTDHRVAYNDPNESSMKYKFLGEEVSIIPVSGYGTTADYQAAGFKNYYGYGEKGVTGIALVQRGEISFVDKIQNASAFMWSYYDSSKGTYVSECPIKAVLVYDNVDGELITMSTSGTYLTSAFISKADGEAIVEAVENGCDVKIRVQADDELVKWDQAGEMSEFTSWGAGPSLELKPEITAPGGNIWSSIVDDSSRLKDPENYNGSYGMMSGTSMAAPHMTGITALVEQYVQKEHNATKMLNADLTSQLLMSTAIPQKQADGNYYSPRVQGAGLANAAAAIKTPAYITVDGQSVGKLELKDDPEKTGSYDINFYVHNLTNEAVTYQASLVLQYPATETVETEWGDRQVMLDADQKLGEFSLGEVTVAANKNTEVSQTVVLSAEQKETLDAFTNGTYVEGYVILTSEKEEVPQIGLPLLAFYGDWTSAPIFDESVWLDEPTDGETVLNNETTWGTSDVAYFDGYSYYTLGMNPFDEDAAATYNNFYDGNITLSPEDGLYRSINDFVLYQLREARAVIVEVHDSNTNELYYHDIATYLWKSVYNSSYATAIPTSVSYFTESYWSGTDLEGNLLPNGTQCTMTITAYGDGEYPTTYNETLGREATDFDSLVPGEVEPTFNGRKMDMTGDVISFSVLIDTEAPVMTNNAVSCKVVDGQTILSGAFSDDDGSIASVAVYPQVKRTYKQGYGDPAYYEYGMDKINPFLNMTITEEDVHEIDFSCDVTEYAHTNESYTGENNYYNYEWTGNVYVFCGDYGGNDRGYAVTVNTDPGLVLSQTSALLKPGDSFNLSVIDNTDENTAITRTSSNPEVAVINEEGLVTAIAAGQTTITVSNGTSEAVCIVAVQEETTQIEDFKLTIDNFSGVKPNGSLVVNVTDIQPSGVTVNSAEWKVYEDDPDLYEGLLTVQQNSTNGMSGEIYLQASASGDDEVLIPGSTGYLEVTLNRVVDEDGEVIDPGVTRRMTLDWTDLYYQTTDEDLISDLYGGQQTIYVEQGETATLIAKYNNSNVHQSIDVKLYSPEGASNYSSSNPTEPSKGLVLDGPDFASVGGKWEGKIVNLEGYALPESVQIGYRYPNSDGSWYEYWWNGSYGYYTYDSATGEIVVKNAPYGSTNELVIRADGVVSEGNPAGELSGETYTKPEALYGPFEWTVTEGTETAGELTTEENILMNGYSKNVAYFTPAEPGVSYITATTKDGTYSVNFAVISNPVIAETLKLDTNKVTLKTGETYALTATLTPEPTLEKHQKLTWTSFNPEVASIDENGVITAHAAGDAYIKVCTAVAPGRGEETQSYCLVHVEAATHTVIFCDHDGTVLDTQTVEDGAAANAPEVPEREGYTFKGWDKDFSNVTEDMTVTAVYAKNTADPEDSSKDVPVEMYITSAGSTQTGGSTGSAIDGDTSTFWEVAWDIGATNPELLWYQIELEEAVELEALRYYPRWNESTSGGRNGFITDYVVTVSMDGENWTEAASGSWEMAEGWKIAEFDKAVTAKYVRLTATGTYADVGNDTNMSIAEIRVKSVEKVDYVPTVKKDTLEAAISKAEALNATDYVDFTAVEEALAAAKTVLANEEATQEEVDAAASDLNAAVKALVKLATETDKAALKEAIDNAKALNAADYVDFTAVEAALTAAEEVYANEKASQSEVKAATNKLNKAIKALVEVVVEEDEVVRLSGTDRYATGYAAADELKAVLGVEKFDTVIIATGKNYADALSGSYLAAVKNAPILLTNGKAENVAELHAYIKANVTEGGKVYILGGEGAVPEAVEAIEGYDVTRLSGASRYETNLAILAEAGYEGQEDLLVATGKSFADSLSASAAARPILLVKPNTALTDDQKAVAANFANIYVIGGTGAVSAATEEELAAYGNVTRLSGASRYETSVAVAEAFFTDPETVVLAYGKNFPDGLCGGALAAALNAPLILTKEGNEDAAAAYVAANGIASGYVLGGEGVLPNDTVVTVFGLESADEIK